MPEFGVRLALGARPARLLRGVLGGGLRLVGVGLVLGTLGSLAVSRLLEGVLTEVGPRDPGPLPYRSQPTLLASADLPPG